jgi:membrane fusion protein, multidrug efflux system
MPLADSAPRSLVILVVALSTVALTACGGREPVPATDATDGHAALVTVEVGTETAPGELLLDGVAEAVNQATMSAQTAGRVAEVAIEVNDRVKRGDLLMRLRASEQVAGLGQAQAALQAAQARDAQARAQHDRIRDMYERKVVARATLDEAVAARDSAGANLAAARAGLESAREGVAYTELRAPYDGVVIAKRVQAGEVVAPGMPLVTVAALDAMRVIVEVPQSAAAAVQTARAATVYVGDERIAATKITLHPAAEPQSGTFRARVDLPDGAVRPAPGTFAKVGFVTGEASRVLVPRSAVVERSELRAVYVVTPGGRVVLRQVRLGRAAGDRIEVIAGLAQGEKVAIDPAAAGLAARLVTASGHE